MEIAVVGNSEFIIGFQLAGIQMTYPADDDEKLKDVVTKLLENENVAILVIKGSDMQRLPPRLRIALEESVTPTVVAIGAEEGGITMRERIIKAMGVDLWK
ncbi:MAG: V-type ATP synthase subunit F [Methanomicrobiaceae archaeon]|nr:V-type ATP synthase subunit F [Methanomicrobiaceae archaeon]